MNKMNVSTLEDSRGQLHGGEVVNNEAEDGSCSKKARKRLLEKDAQRTRPRSGDKIVARKYS
jgi:hypothetical protein